MNPGTVILFKNFVFKDGQISPQKLVLILAIPNKKFHTYLCCLATSQQHYKAAQLGCHFEKNYYFIDARQSGFEKDTWIVFDKVYEFTSSEILSEGLKHNIYSLFNLDPTLWRAIKNCILKSEDVEYEYLERIKKS